MSDDKVTLGQEGEKIAVFFLKKHGFNILETNYRTKFAEIDIIAKENDTLCFIEVKTRQSLRKGLPREAVTFSKQKKIILGASLYLKQKKLNDVRTRFDVVEVILSHNRPDINLIKHAFQVQ
ncbi:MAG: YraN family protein [Desulfobacula sp.]|nr:YraN family protein [Desulfobacula sp.]